MNERRRTCRRFAHVVHELLEDVRLLVALRFGLESAAVFGLRVTALDHVVLLLQVNASAHIERVLVRHDHRIPLARGGNLDQRVQRCQHGVAHVESEFR